MYSDTLHELHRPVPEPESDDALDRDIARQDRSGTYDPTILPRVNRRTAERQAADAVRDLERPPESYLAWPWPLLDDLTGSLAPGEIWYVVAFSGVGKTTFLASLVNRWIEAGKRVAVLPLEQHPKVFRTVLACQRLGIHPGDALSGLLRRRRDGRLGPLIQELGRMAAPPVTESLMVSSVREINLLALERAFQTAQEDRADVLIIDHIDHIEAGPLGADLYANSVAVNKGLLRLTQRYGPLVIAASQLNNESLRGGDHLAKFAPPREQFVKFGGHKREIATGMLGLYRPLRPLRPGEDSDEYVAQLKKARAGDLEPEHVLAPAAMGVVQMKDRHYGRDGRRITLGVRHGAVVDPPEEYRDDRRYGI
jgi:KaiC/GvpD/RAD55 family RecA-like ATPase